MTDIIIKIEKKSYTIKYSFKAYKILLKLWKKKKISDLAAVIGKLNFKEGVEPEVDQYDRLGEIVLAGILTGLKKGETTTLDSDDCVEYLLHNVDDLQKIFTLFLESFPLQPDAKKGK